ncbi:hypothetical protein A2961_03480 [Candidatus Woesebacteria bacterium RIFCSPLOWO2_01_FULL_39_21]|uniref:Uncharacterized protein n=1 Tax=Candidatus Woesebacteria bacterium RIFCSPLOWO2_01_FULL_39_21 TaxID=1802519 RepID=A0A1F8BEC8_9BACT|nr:MAG: hypothetical protein A2691_00510 [Candidatus Woesebacteria bacterium RIFCSPHIGHO2_01_FULL_39_23]OGM62404.1 MAG: hypothetical protein A2961_03480 [Candidatus Woesebacteria bacterium RIFCSPLOWO2_01_FULL_39_21]
MARAYFHQKGYSHLVVLGIVGLILVVAVLRVSNSISPRSTSLPESPATVIPSVSSPTPGLKPSPKNTPTAKPVSNSKTPSPTTNNNAQQGINNTASTSTPKPTSVSLTPTPTSTPTPTTQTYQNGPISATVTCAESHGGLNKHIDLVISASGIDTKPNGAWTYIRINDAGKNIYLAYDSKDSSYSGYNGVTIHKQIYSIRNADLLVLESGKTYTAKVSQGGYTTGDPTGALGSTLAEVSFAPNCSF